MVHGQAVLLVAHTVQDHNGIDHIRIISARQAEKKRGNNMSKTVTYKMDLNNPPVLSAEQKQDLKLWLNVQIVK